MHLYMVTCIWASMSDDSGGGELRILKAAAQQNKSCFSFCVLWLRCTAASVSKHKISFKQNKVEH